MTNGAIEAFDTASIINKNTRQNVNKYFTVHPQTYMCFLTSIPFDPEGQGRM